MSQPNPWAVTELDPNLVPPAKEHTAPTTLHFGTHWRPETVAKRLARTLACQFHQDETSGSPPRLT